MAAAAPMNAMMTLMNILLVNIILILVLAILVREENSVFGHAHSRDGITALSITPAGALSIGKTF